MIEIYPEIEFSAKCPFDSSDLEIAGVVIPGMRCLADGICPTCGKSYYIDLPIGQAIKSPTIINKATGEIYDPLDVHWFSQRLKEGYLNRVETEIIPVVHKFFEVERIVIINCIDFLYGHSLLKLLNVERYLNQAPQLGCCVLIPHQLMHLVPEGVAEIWEFPIVIKEGWKWYNSLQSWIEQELKRRQKCFLSRGYSHPSNKIYNLSRFVRNLPDIKGEISQQEPIILFSYREDRIWGRNIDCQQRNIQKLYNQLSKKIPEMVFVLVGFGKSNEIRATGAKLIDLRTNKFDVDRDRLWMAYMSVADCAIGVHGSNMLLPSGLAKSTLELVPKSRLGNTVQDFLFTGEKHDIREALLSYRMLYGNETLSDIQVSDVFDMVANLVFSVPVNSEWFKLGENKKKDELLIDELLLWYKKKNANQPIFYQKKRGFIKEKIRNLAQGLVNFLD